MSVANGQPINQTVTNAAFISRTQNSNTVGIVDLQNPSSGPNVNNVQQTINTIKSDITPIPQLLATTQDHEIRITDLEGKQFDSIEENNSLTGSDAELEDFVSTVLKLTNTSLNSIEMIQEGFGGQRLVLINSTTNVITLKNLSGATLTRQIVTGIGEDLEIEIDASILLVYDLISEKWQIVGGTGGSEKTVGFQEELAGDVDGVNTQFGPLSFVPSSAESLLIFVDGVLQRIDQYDLTGSIVELDVAPIAGQRVYAFYMTLGNPSPLPSISGIFKVEYRTLNATEITNKELILQQTPVLPTEVMLDVTGGGGQFYGDSFTVSSDVLSWDSLALDGLLSVGDKLRINYVY
jgi:hypothetical protein